MCQSFNNIKFCTCGVIDPNDTSIKFVWELRSLKNAGSPVLGKFMQPSEDLGGDINEQKILEVLSNTSCFDFDYRPVENDNLVIRYNGHLQDKHFISFIYKRKKWRSGQWIHAINRETKEIGKGYLEETPGL